MSEDAEPCALETAHLSDSSPGVTVPRPPQPRAQAASERWQRVRRARLKRQLSDKQLARKEIIPARPAPLPEDDKPRARPAPVRRQTTVSSSRELARLSRQVSVDLLAREWLGKLSRSSQGADAAEEAKTRAFLTEDVLPTLVQCVETLLVEAQKRGRLEDREPHPDFNPVNHLARLLMRNNPRFAYFPAAASPYVQGLRAVREELRSIIAQVDSEQATNRLAQASVVARRRRAEKEREMIRLRGAEEEMRRVLGEALREGWTVVDEASGVPAEIWMTPSEVGHAWTKRGEMGRGK